MLRRVLVIDDVATTRETLRRMLMAPGVQVDTAADAESALDSIRKAEARGAPLDAVVTDFHMAWMNGRDLLEIVARDHPSVRRVLVSGYDDPPRDPATVGVAHAFLPKPIDAARLRAAALGTDHESS